MQEAHRAIQALLEGVHEELSLHVFYAEVRACWPPVHDADQTPVAVLLNLCSEWCALMLWQAALVCCSNV